MIHNATAYEDDFFAWTLEQARLLRSGQVADLDLEHLAEDLFGEAYARTRLDAADETGLPLKTFPVASPFSLTEAFDPLFPPDLGGPEQELARSRN